MPILIFSKYFLWSKRRYVTNFLSSKYSLSSYAPIEMVWTEKKTEKKVNSMWYSEGKCRNICKDQNKNFKTVWNSIIFMTIFSEMCLLETIKSFKCYTQDVTMTSLKEFRLNFFVFFFIIIEDYAFETPLCGLCNQILFTILHTTEKVSNLFVFCSKFPWIKTKFHLKCYKFTQKYGCVILLYTIWTQKKISIETLTIESLFTQFQRDPVFSQEHFLQTKRINAAVFLCVLVCIVMNLESRLSVHKV